MTDKAKSYAYVTYTREEVKKGFTLSWSRVLTVVVLKKEAARKRSKQQHIAEK